MSVSEPVDESESVLHVEPLDGSLDTSSDDLNGHTIKRPTRKPRATIQINKKTAYKQQRADTSMDPEHFVQILGKWGIEWDKEKRVLLTGFSTCSAFLSSAACCSPS